MQGRDTEATAADFALAVGGLFHVSTREPSVSQGRLNGDPAAFAEAGTTWQRVGAGFEQAST